MAIVAGLQSVLECLEMDTDRHGEASEYALDWVTSRDVDRMLTERGQKPLTEDEWENVADHLSNNVDLQTIAMEWVLTQRAYAGPVVLP